MYCEFYLDVFFAVNLLLDFQILCLTNLMLRGTANPLRAFLGSILGAAGMCLFVVLTPEIHTGKAVMCYGIMAVVMVWTGCKCKSPGAVFHGLLFFWGGALLMGGVLTALPYGIRKSIFLFLAITVTAYWILYIGIRLCKYLKGKESPLCQVTLAFQGKEVKVMGLYDTGNRLFDKKTGKAVSVMEYSSFCQLLDKEQCRLLEHFCKMETREMDSGRLSGTLNPRFLCYTSVGCQGGLLPVVTADRMTVSYKGEKKQVKNAAVGLSMAALSPDKSYEIIVSPAFWDF